MPWTSDGGTLANTATMNFQGPWEVTASTSAFPPSDIPAEMIVDGAVTRIGDLFVDTRHDAVIKVHNGNRAFLLGEGTADPVEAPTFQIDASRHPQNLLPWQG